MKIAGLLFVLTAATACRPYKVTQWSYKIPLSRYSNVDNSTNRLKSFNDLPKRIRNIPEFKNQAVTTDSAYFNSSPQATSLFLYGVYDKTAKAGYVVQRFCTGEKKLANQCTLFIVRGDSLTFDFCGAPEKAFTWADIKPYLNKPNDKLFGGGITVLKPKRQKK